MANINTIQTITGNPTSGKTGAGYKGTVPELRKFEKTLLDTLNSGDRRGYTTYLIHKVLPLNLGDTINVRRLLGLESDPRKNMFDKNTIDGPELKELHGLAVEFRLEWFGNGVSFNDVAAATHLDNLMDVAMPQLLENAVKMTNKIAGLALYEGASKAYVKKYEPSKNLVTYGATKGDVAAPFNLAVLRDIKDRFVNNKETYQLSDGTSITVAAKIRPLAKGMYKALVSDRSKTDLTIDQYFLDTFVKNGGRNADDVKNEKITDIFGWSIETIDDALTIDSSSTDVTTEVKVEGEGDLEITFAFGHQFGADVKLAGHGVKMFRKQPNTTDSGDVYGRYAFITYKIAYNAQVVNSKAIYAIVTKPHSFSTGNIVEASEMVPIQ